MQRASFRRATAALFLGICAPLTVGMTGVDSDLEQRLLQTHNIERASLRIAPLKWNADLALGAKEWAEHLSQTGRFEHSPDEPGPQIGENIWAGTSGRYAPERMVGLWLDEKRYFKPGVFPENSTSGDPRDVAHYTQVVWRRSTDVGCYVARGTREDILVCRYLSAGNVRGVSPL